jgi:hypothetical protein
MLGAALLVVAAVAVLLWRAVEEPVNALAMPEGRPTPRVFEEEQYEAAKELARIRLGSFERPEDVPGYQVLEKTPTESLGTRSAQLVVGTHSRGREAFTLITATSWPATPATTSSGCTSPTPGAPASPTRPRRCG